MSSSSKLHPIYVALDNHQYSRAIKLCLLQPDSNYLCQALLAHSYAKSGQRYKALLTIQKLLPCVDQSFFSEFQAEISYLHGLEGPPDVAAPSPTLEKKIIVKKGKKKCNSSQPLSNAAQSTPNVPILPFVPEGWNLVDQLDTPPALPDNWERLPPAPANSHDPESSILEPTLLSTLSMTMISQLKLPLTAFQLYCWAASASNNNSVDEEIYLRKAYANGLIVLLSSQYQCITSEILSNLQVLALQLTRMHSATMTLPVNLWAAQTALWQLQYAPNNGDADEKVRLRLSMLPRLAESLALKCLENLDRTSLADVRHDVDNSLVATESFLLYMRALDIQGESKYKTKLEAIDAKLSSIRNTSSNGQQDMLYPPCQTLLQMKVDVLRKLKQFDLALNVLEELIDLYPDDWVYWKSHLECSISAADGNYMNGCNRTIQLASSVIEKRKISAMHKYPLRAPRWIDLEAATVLLRDSPHHENTITILIGKIKSYGLQFAPSASSTFSDLCPYIDRCLDSRTIENAISLLDWSKSIREQPTSDDVKIRRSELRLYIFSIQLNFKVLARYKELRADHLPTWQELFETYRKFQAFEISNDSDQAQKESRPGDELILLAAQILLSDQSNTLNKMIVVHILEAAIRYSPYNAYLKICLILTYSQLNCASRCWDLYSELYIKHIQQESCTYLILKILHSGGFYRETIHVCQDILGLQRASTREAGDFTGRAMENGSICKADEIISFHRKRMFNSLTTLEAKGLVLDCAPMFVQDNSQGSIGAVHGIVGGESDLARVKQMIAEAHNPSGAFSLLRLQGSVEQNIDNFSDNRDFGILSFEILHKTTFDTPEQILSDSIRRSCHHNLLIRSALCVDSTRGPKKGKLAKATQDSEKRSRSLLKSVATCDHCVKDAIQPLGYASLLETMKCMCRVLVTISTGMNSEAETVFDRIEERESAGVVLLQQASESLLAAKSELGLMEGRAIPRTSKLLPDCIVPIFALFQMNAKIAESFGWGKRKRKTKKFASALADLSLNLMSLIDDMISCITSLPYNELPRNISSDVIDPTAFLETHDAIIKAQTNTKSRIEIILDDMKSYLVPFQLED